MSSIEGSSGGSNRDRFARELTCALDSTTLKRGSFARRVGVTPQTVSGWLSGDYVPKDDDQIAKVVEVLRAERASVDLDMLVECWRLAAQEPKPVRLPRRPRRDTTSAEAEPAPAGPTRPPVSARTLVAVGAILSMIVIALLGWVATIRERPVSTTSPPAGPPADIRMHEVWASSAENTWHRFSLGQWAMTDFPVTQPYLRSVEVAVADVPEVQLIVYDEHHQELAAGEAPVVDYRAKYIFEKPVDIHDYVGKHLFLQVRNISSTRMRVYFTKFDRDRSVTSYLWCRAPRATNCPNPEPQDLSALIIGWSRPS